MFDKDGVQVQSLNEAVKAPDAAGQSRWPKERKPTVDAKVHDIAVLQHLAAITGEEVYAWCLDFADYFSQLGVAPACQWMNVVHWLSVDGEGSADGCFVVENKLGFGVAASSNICQRLADSLLRAFRKILDARESRVHDDILEQEPESPLAQWIRTRRSLGKHQCRRYEISQFTDDPMLVAVSAPVLTSSLALFVQMMKTIGLELSHPRKFQVGKNVRWLGLDWLLSAGMLLVPTNKKLRAIAEITDIVRGQPTSFTSYRSSVSFLTYLRPYVEGADLTYLYSIFDPISAALRSGASPSDNVHISDGVVQKLNEWLGILRSIGGVHFAECLNPAPPSGAARLHLAVYGDAALEGEGEAGLGGYAHGLYWQLYIYGRWKQLPISVLEFVALIGNVLVFEPIIGRAMATFYTDSKNCFDVLLNSKSRAKLMQMAHEYLLKLPAYQRLKTRAAIEHVYGPANPAADAVSRGKMEFFLELCKQLGVQPRQLEVPIEVKHLLDQLCARYEELAGDVRPKDKAVRVGEASHPGPKRSAVRVHVTAQPPVAVTAPPAEGSTSVEAASVERPPPRPGGRP